MKKFLFFILALTVGFVACENNNEGTGNGNGNGNENKKAGNGNSNKGEESNGHSPLRKFEKRKDSSSISVLAFLQDRLSWRF